MKAVVMILGLVMVAAGLGVVFPAIAADPRDAMYAWHFATMFGTTLAMGALFLLMLGHAAQASWLIVLRRLVEHLVGTLPVLALFFIPTLVWMEHLFPWAEGGIEMSHHVADKVAKKRYWLNDGAFVTRTIAYWVLLVTTGELLRYWSRQQDGATDELTRTRYGRRMRVLSCVGFPVLGLVMTFAFYDWLISLEPAWYSTVYGAAVLAGGFTAAVGALAVSMVLANELDWFDGMEKGVSDDHRHAVGRVLFASICFWAYLQFVQYMLIWIADLPEEVTYFVRRQSLGWQWVGLAIVIGHFVVPFFLLLSRKLKEIPATLGLFGAWIVLFHVVANFYLVVPALRVELRLHWADPFALVAVAGAMLVTGFARSIRMAPVPVGDPGLPASIEYSSS